MGKRWTMINFYTFKTRQNTLRYLEIALGTFIEILFETSTGNRKIFENYDFMNFSYHSLF